jgi:hypothetical protein
MPETAVADSSQTSTAAEIVSTPSASENAKGGINEAMKDFDVITTPKSKPEPKVPEPAKADPKTPTKETPKPDPGADPKAAKPKSQEVDWEKVDPKVKGAHFKVRREMEDKIGGYEKRIKELESKPKETAADVKLVEQYQKQINELNQKLAQSDYSKSAEFQKQYVGRWQSEYQSATNEIKALMVTLKDATTGEEKQRAATENDFKRILALPPGDQDEAVNALFGRSAPRVFSRLLELNRIERDGQRALDEYASTHETKSKETELETQRQRAKYEETLQKSDADLRKTWPHFFDVDPEDADASEALTKGYEYVDHVLKNSDAMSPEDRAAYSSVLRARAAAMPRLVLEKNRLAEEVNSLKEELKKFRSSDPGGASERPQGGAKTDDVGGIADMAAKFDA